MSARRAQCSCGQLSAVCTGEPVRVSVCHCLECKRRSGSEFSFNAQWAAENVVITGAAKEFARIGDEGTRAVFSFCPECGVTVYYRPAKPGIVAIPAGAFADVSFPQPGVSVYEERKCAWMEIHAEPLERWD